MKYLIRGLIFVAAAMLTLMVFANTYYGSVLSSWFVNVAKG